MRSAQRAVSSGRTEQPLPPDRSAGTCRSSDLRSGSAHESLDCPRQRYLDAWRRTYNSSVGLLERVGTDMILPYATSFTPHFHHWLDGGRSHHYLQPDCRVVDTSPHARGSHCCADWANPSSIGCHWSEPLIFVSAHYAGREDQYHRTRDGLSHYRANRTSGNGFRGILSNYIRRHDTREPAHSFFKLTDYPKIRGTKAG